MTCPCTALDCGGMKTVDVKLIAQLFQKPQLAFIKLAVRRADVTSERIGGLVQAFGKVGADETKQRIKPFFNGKQVKNRLRHHAKPIHIVICKDRQMVDSAFDFHQLGGSHVFIRGRNGNHDGHKAILRGEGMFDLLGHGSAFQACAVAVQNIDCCPPRQ